VPDELALWHRNGLVMSRTVNGAGSEVVGDPCVVWDEDASAWRMFLFFEPPGHASALAPAAAPSRWSEPKILNFNNPETLGGGTQKPWIVMDPHRPNHAARVDGKYWLLTVSHDGNAREKRVQRAWAYTLVGPWTLEEGDLIPRGTGTDFDANHVDAVSGYWFDEIDSFVYYYMGYPTLPQSHTISPLGSSIGVAVQRAGETSVTKLPPILRPVEQSGNWASGWLGGIQILPGIQSRWVGIINASPTPPDHDGVITSEEPAPSMGGFARTDKEIPIAGWTIDEEPIERIEDIPDTAVKGGEGTNLWRQYIFLDGDTATLYYNSGFYGQEQLYSKSVSKGQIGLA